jgi:hypothetical protein
MRDLLTNLSFALAWLAIRHDCGRKQLRIRRHCSLNRPLDPKVRNPVQCAGAQLGTSAESNGKPQGTVRSIERNAAAERTDA